MLLFNQRLLFVTIVFCLFSIFFIAHKIKGKKEVILFYALSKDRTAGLCLPM